MCVGDRKQRAGGEGERAEVAEFWFHRRCFWKGFWERGRWGRFHAWRFPPESHGINQIRLLANEPLIFLRKRWRIGRRRGRVNRPVPPKCGFTARICAAAGWGMDMRKDCDSAWLRRFQCASAMICGLDGGFQRRGATAQRGEEVSGEGRMEKQLPLSLDC
jgi:hypothetical protein